jgi:hypothetical protein
VEGSERSDGREGSEGKEGSQVTDGREGSEGKEESGRRKGVKEVIEGKGRKGRN